MNAAIDKLHKVFDKIWKAVDCIVCRLLQTSQAHAIATYKLDYSRNTTFTQYVEHLNPWDIPYQ